MSASEWKVLLGSGLSLIIKRVRLYEEKDVTSIASLRAEAAKNLGGVSTGIGFIGSPAWVLGGAAVLGLIEGALSNSARKRGLELFQIAQQKTEELLEGGTFFEMEDVANGAIPHPETWSATLVIKKQIDVGSMGGGLLGDTLRQHQKTKKDIRKTEKGSFIDVTIERKFVHNGDEFLVVESDKGVVNLRWANVVAYQAPQIANSVQPSLPDNSQSNSSFPTFDDMKSFPRGTTLYQAASMRLALLPGGEVLAEGAERDIRYPSVDAYRDQAKDSSRWNVIYEY